MNKLIIVLKFELNYIVNRKKVVVTENKLVFSE